MAKIEGAIGRQFQSLSIAFDCAVNTKFTSWTGVLAPDIYGAHWAKHCWVRLAFTDTSLYGCKFDNISYEELHNINSCPSRIDTWSLVIFTII
jgi:hypothetical protein